VLYAGLPEREQLGPSAFLGPVVGLHLQPEALEAHEHAANLFPGITFAVDYESWNTALLLVVPLDLAADDPAFGRLGDLRARWCLRLRPQRAAEPPVVLTVMSKITQSDEQIFRTLSVSPGRRARPAPGRAPSVHVPAAVDSRTR
jgi:hypothetical protein